jgi:hypothetical protein
MASDNASMVTLHHKSNHFSNFVFEASILHFEDVLANKMQLENSGE